MIEALARRIARQWNTDHHEYLVQPDTLAVLPKLVRHYGEPYADSSVVPAFYLAPMARTKVTVALTGDGGDESFAGYERSLANGLAERLRRVPGGSWPAQIAASLLPSSLNPKNRQRRAKRFFTSPRSLWPSVTLIG